MATDYINRGKFAMHLADIQYGEAPTGRTGENIDYQNGVYAGLDMAYVALERFPAADVRPVVRGTWIHREAFDYYDQNNVTHFHAQCSNCGFLHDFIDCHSAQYLFCPECGADMRPEGRTKE